MKITPPVVTQVASDQLKEPVLPIPTKPTASQLVRDFFEDNHIEMKLEAAENINVWDGTGVLLADKPLLKITYLFKESK